jgi:hypothetical protein
MKTQITSKEPLTDEQLLFVAPSIFAPVAHSSRSEKYSFIPTIKVIDGLRAEGFYPFTAGQSISRIEGKSNFTKHMLRFRQVQDITNEVGSEINEIVLINSHDGTSSYQMMAGTFRIVCMNGLVSGDITNDIHIRHNSKESLVDGVIEAACSIVEEFPVINEKVRAMKQIELSEPEQVAFAESALSLKYDDKSPIAPNIALLPHRYEDNKKDLWTTFNTVQENLIKGGQRGDSITSKRIMTRPVKSIDNNVRLNKALWTLADKMAEIKTGYIVAA